MKKFRNILGKILNVISYIVIGFLIIYILLMLYSKYVKKDNLVSIGNYYVFKIGSGSMEPTIHVYDYIIVKKDKKYNKNDIVTVDMNGYFVTHRIKKINNNELITKGDANNTEDAPVKTNQIVGKYIYTSKILTFVLNRYIVSMAILIFIILVEIILNLTNKYFDNIEGNNKNQELEK